MHIRLVYLYAHNAHKLVLFVIWKAKEENEKQAGEVTVGISCLLKYYFIQARFQRPGGHLRFFPNTSPEWSIMKCCVQPPCSCRSCDREKHIPSTLLAKWERVWVCVCQFVCVCVALGNPAPKEHNKSHFSWIMWFREGGQWSIWKSLQTTLSDFVFAFIWTKHGPIPTVVCTKRTDYQMGLEILQHM